MKHNQTIIALALVAGALVGAVQTLACNPTAALTGRLAGEFIGAAVFYMIVFWLLLTAAAWVVGKVRVRS